MVPQRVTGSLRGATHDHLPASTLGASMTQQYPQPSPYGQQPPPGWVPPGAVPDPRHWQGSGQPVPPSAPKRKRRWPWAVVAVLLLAVVIGSAAGKETPSSGAAPRVDEV